MQIKILVFILSFLFAQMPHRYDINNIESDLNRNARSSGLNANSIVNLEVYSDSIIYIGTSNGLHIGRYFSESPSFFLLGDYSSTQNLPEGGNPALVIDGDVIAASGVTSYGSGPDTYAKGTGVSYSIDEGETWVLMPQPKDSSENQHGLLYKNKYACPWSVDILYDDKEDCNDNCTDCFGDSGSCKQYDYTSFGNQDLILNLSIVVDVQNVSYDLAVHGDYIYAASWAGSLRRFDFTDSQSSWEIVPLPMDNQTSLSCIDSDYDNYQINPIGNYKSKNGNTCGYKFDNHKVFTVYSVEDTLWVGTANGINKGIVYSPDCIVWEKMTADMNGFYDDWIIGFKNQILNDGTNRIWAITWDRETPASYKQEGGPPSYSDNGGLTWEVPKYLRDLNILTHNISIYDNLVYVSSYNDEYPENQGLYVSSSDSDYELWEKIILPEYIPSSGLMDAEKMTIFNDMWLGTSPISILNSESLDYEYISSDGNIKNSFYAYPNPFIIEASNSISFSFNGDEHNLSGDISIYDFSMDRVITIESNALTSWDGKNEFGNEVSNGIYICKYDHHDGNSYFFNIMVINSK